MGTGAAGVGTGAYGGDGTNGFWVIKNIEKLLTSCGIFTT